MHAYFAMTWNTGCQRATQHAGKIRNRINATRNRLQIVEVDGLLVIGLAGSSAPMLTPIEGPGGNVRGCVAGPIFRSSRTARSATQLSSIPIRQDDLDDASRILLDSYWGHFVAFTRNGREARILAEPTGYLPCYYTEEEGVLMAFSNMELCDFIDRSRFTINNNFVRTLLIYDKFTNGTTGLNEVSELSGGEELSFKEGRTSVTALWDPRTIAMDARRWPEQEAAEELAAVTDQVIGSWASCYNDIALSLSGGLDSSIVLDSLTRCGTNANISAFHYALDSADSGELHYAQAAAEAAGIVLEPIRLDPFLSIQGLADYPLTVRPTRQRLAPDAQSFIAPAVGSGNGAVFTGQGGDHLFRASRSAASFTDHIQLNGISSETPGMLLQTARLSGKSVWAILGENVCRAAGLLKNPLSTFEEGASHRRTLMNSHLDGIEAIVASLPAWATDPAGLPPGKFEQVSSLMHMIQLRPHLLPSGPRETVHPLISRPLVETCLRFPSYLLSARGVSRGLARRAFEGRLPSLILERTSKGSASRFYSDRVAAIAALAEQELASGELFHMGLIQQSDVHRLLGNSQHRQASSGNMALVYLGIEYWLRAWRQAIHGKHIGA